jgi:hypothetical protein
MRACICRSVHLPSLRFVHPSSQRRSVHLWFLVSNHPGLFIRACTYRRPVVRSISVAVDINGMYRACRTTDSRNEIGTCCHVFLRCLLCLQRMHPAAGSGSSPAQCLHSDCMWAEQGLFFNSYDNIILTGTIYFLCPLFFAVM